MTSSSPEIEEEHMMPNFDSLCDVVHKLKPIVQAILADYLVIIQKEAK